MLIEPKIAMKNTLVLILFLLLAHAVLAQQSVPVFASKKDSADYAQVQKGIQEIFTRNQLNNTEKRRLDSLMAISSSLRAKVVGFRVIYKPKESFTAYNELVSGQVKPEDVTTLSFSNNKSKKIPGIVFNCTHLKELELVNTHVRKLSRKFNQLKQLNSIYIYNNTPKGRLKLGKNSFTEEFLIRGTEAAKLPKTYGGLNALRELDLSANIGLSNFPDITKNIRLTKLNLLNNQLTLTDLERIQNSSLQELNVLGNKISSVPSTISNFSALKKVVFSNNPITAIDPAIGKLLQLEELAFYNCKLPELSEGLENLPNLKVIDLYYNQLKSITINLTKLQRLEILYLSHNALTALPENIGGVTNLQELYASHNKLNYLPESTAELKNLKVLRINNNSLTSFPYQILSLRNIENLDVSTNNLYELPTELKEFEKLQIFALTGNPWDKQEDVLQLAEALRKKGTIVHLNTLEKEVEPPHQK